jgi:hypothetical protein
VIEVPSRCSMSIGEENVSGRACFDAVFTEIIIIIIIVLKTFQNNYNYRSAYRPIWQRQGWMRVTFCRANQTRPVLDPTRPAGIYKNLDSTRPDPTRQDPTLGRPDPRQTLTITRGFHAFSHVYGAYIYRAGLLKNNMATADSVPATLRAEGLSHSGFWGLGG